MVLDFFEHIYEDDIDFVKGELFRVASKYIFLQTAISGTEGGYFLNKGEKVPERLEGCAVAGHVTVQTERWWLDRLDHDDWMLRRDLKEHFIGVTGEDIIRNWILNSILVYERIGD